MRKAYGETNMVIILGIVDQYLFWSHYIFSVKHSRESVEYIVGYEDLKLRGEVWLRQKFESHWHVLSI